VDFPADLTVVTDDDLNELESALVAEFDRLHDEGSTDLVALTELAEQVEQVRAEQTVRAEAAEAAAEAVAALAERVRPAVDDLDESDDTDDPADTEPVADTEPEPTVDAEPEPELVTAAAKPTRRPSASAVSRRTQRPAVTAPSPSVTITAAADVPGYAAGAILDLSGVAVAMHDRARSLGIRSQRVPVARIASPLPADDFTDGTISRTLSVLDRVTNPSSLVAAGGWCTPSETLFDLFAVESADGLFDLPTIGVSRGGVQVPDFLGFGDADGALWTWTEDDDVDALESDGPRKACVRIPCPDFTEYRLEAEGLCITHGNLTDRAYPELTSRFVQLAINGHLHRLSTAKLGQVVGDAVAVAADAAPSDTAGEILSAIDLQVADYKSQYAISNSAVLEAVFPAWTREAIRANLAMRAGVDMLAVSDAQITDWFAMRKVRPQFVFGYQRLFDAAPAEAWPSTLKFLLYTAGAYFAGDGGAIDLGVVRDSTLNAANDFTAAWTEQFYLVGRRGPQAREVEVLLNTTGVTACCPPAPAAD